MTGIVGTLLDNQAVRHTMRRKWSLLQSQTTQSLPESPTVVTYPGRVLLQVQVGYNQLSLLQKLAQPPQV